MPQLAFPRSGPRHGSVAEDDRKETLPSLIRALLSPSTTPQLASGAGIAVEDALVLAEELTQDRSVAEALHRFTERREERCRLVVEGSIEIGRLEQAQAPVEEQTAVVERALARLAGPV